MVKSLDEVRRQFFSDEAELTRHAALNVVQRGISEREIREAGAGSVSIEEYPDDKFSPGCLTLGYTSDGRPLHILVSLSDANPIKVITVYEPDPAEWINHRIRR